MDGYSLERRAISNTHRRPRPILAVEELECRLLLAVSAFANDGILTITGDANGNRIVVVQRGDQSVGVFGDNVDLGTFSSLQRIVINADDGSDRLEVAADVLIAAQLNGEGGDDLLIGGGGDDTLTGGAGDDTYKWRDLGEGPPCSCPQCLAGMFGSVNLPQRHPGNDSIVELPGEGFDTIDLSAVFSQVTVLLTPDAGIPSGTGGASFSVDDIEQIVGGQGDDTVVFGDGAQLANGNGIFNGQGGENTLDYSRYNSSIDVDLSRALATGLGAAAQIQNIVAPPFVTSAITLGSAPSQSPIDLTQQVLSDLGPLEFHYNPGMNLTFENGGYDVLVEYESTHSELVVDGKEYELVQFHFHTPSEHVVEGEQFPMEGHFVHMAADGSLAVVAVFYELTADATPQFDPLIDNLPTVGTETTIPAFDANVLLPPEDMRAYQSYSGSLTTSPFTEGVTWILLENTVSMNAAQVAAIRDIVPGPNNRPLQDRNGRVLREQFV